MERTVIPTTKQRDALSHILEGKSVSKSMLEAGYTEASARNPKNLTERDGFKQLCEDNGLTEHLLVTSLVDDIKNKPKNRKQELELGFKVIGRLRDDKEGPTIAVYNFFNEQQQKRIAARILNGDTAGAQ